MKILHISNDFCLTKVHSMLYQELDRMGVEQTVFNPVRDVAHVGSNRFEGQHTIIRMRRRLFSSTRGCAMTLCVTLPSVA